MAFDPTRFTRCDRAPAWQALQVHYQSIGRGFDLRQAFAGDPRRVEALAIDAPHVLGDLSKNLIDAQARRLLLDLAQQCDLAGQRDALFGGEAINGTEGRQVMHWLLRYPARGAAWRPAGIERLQSELDEVHHTLDAMLAFAEQVRADAAITDIVNIGIGGSDLGPQMAVLALDAYAQPQRRLHFVSNIDGHELQGVLRGLKAENTLFLVASKTFTTLETMTNARSARDWFAAQGGQDVARHFAALTTNVAAAREFGITTTFGFWDWVGGRYSLWSAIGLPIAVAIGADRFRELLAGAHAMDAHFASAPLERNLPLQLALLDVWYRDFHGFGSRSIAPYHSGLRRLPAYLQQLEMESNGKRVDRHGEPVPFDTSPVLWGEPGTNGQHAYFQMLHQGTEVVPVEFIAVREAAHQLPGHHTQLLANVLAQAQALMLGKSDAGGHRHFPGNRPSTFLLLDRLDPSSLGALIAMQEHRVFSSGALWGINSFDQWGVELGKVLAKDLAPRLESGDVEGLDASTAGLIQRLRRGNG
ncbi:glucose-6-phosphate isomerase [Ramlibacter sp. AW1]|uniref:Glucose-6-phosphate isomerase n=1 Tax=Ramlibacter aurantiacus TaxID=2801330 RepID=A0A936ZSC8_9BURK|nr:glucose-6-phosphate isomerase [Ramlibacter aurantiacus]MBL0422755.1 glucose-6-phosphate isomerase [Ramlibacter aurantiacus]